MRFLTCKIGMGILQECRTNDADYAGTSRDVTKSPYKRSLAAYKRPMENMNMTPIFLPVLILNVRSIGIGKQKRAISVDSFMPNET